MMEKNTNEPPKLHSGKWTPEEEAYVEGLMEEFRAGTLDLQEGTTLRSFLAIKLNCKPKRISKKYEGKNYDGKQLYWNSEEEISPEERRARRAKLQRLEHKFKECLKAIEIVKNSRQSGEAKQTELASQPASLDSQKQPAMPSLQLQEPQSPSLRSAAEMYLGRAGPPSSPPMTAAATAAAVLPSATATMPTAAGLTNLDLFARPPSQSEAALAMARRHRQQALELELAAHASSTNPLLGSLQGLPSSSRASMAGLPAGTLGSFLSTPSTLQRSAAAVRQEALLGLGSGLNRPASPTAGLGLHHHYAAARAPSPSTHQSSSLLEHAAALEQARLAMATRNSITGYPAASAAPSLHHFRPTLNTMLAAPSRPVVPAGNQLANAAAYEESLMRLQQPAVRDLGATSDLLRRRLSSQQQQQQQQLTEDECKRQAIEDELNQQRKRQRFM